MNWLFIKGEGWIYYDTKISHLLPQNKCILLTFKLNQPLMKCIDLRIIIINYSPKEDNSGTEWENVYLCTIHLHLRVQRLPAGHVVQRSNPEDMESRSSAPEGDAWDCIFVSIQLEMLCWRLTDRCMFL